DEDAGRPLLRRLPRLQGGGVDLRRGDLLLGLLLGLPPRGDPAAAGVVGGPALPGPALDLRRRPLADQLRPARLARRLPRRGGRLQPVLRGAPARLQRAVAVRRGLRLLLPRVPALADLLRDLHRADLVVGDAAVDRGAPGMKAFGLVMLPLSVLPFVAVRGDV